MTEILRVVESDRTRSRHPEVSERADWLLSFAQPPDQVEDFGYTERAVEAFEELGAQPFYVEDLGAAIAADLPVQEWGPQLLQTDVPDLFAQWNTQPDPEVRGRFAERMSIAVDLLHDAYSREQRTTITARCTRTSWLSPERRNRSSARRSSATGQTRCARTTRNMLHQVG